MSDRGRDPELDAEQAVLDVLYRRLDEVTVQTEDELDRVRRSATVGTPGARAERDSLAEVHAQRLTSLRAVGDRLCFGHLDMVDASRRYVGRIGLADEAGARLLIDWRAPAAEAFYRATNANPLGVLSRRHLTTSGRRVTGMSDEVLDLRAFAAAGRSSEHVSDDGALMLSLNSARTGQMHDIVATIQVEQDEIIREPLGGVLVVQGGPGTGKTAVALHRAAYLLYEHRERLARTGVLLVGPNTRFLRYIDQVLPSLGETGVVLSTPAQLFPGVDAVGLDSPQAAAVKGRARMARVLSSAVRARQKVPPRPIPLDVDGVTITLTPDAVRQSRGRAQASRKPHNEARTIFVRDLLGQLVRQYAAVTNTALDDPGAPDARAEIAATLRESPDVRREVNLCWMPLTPQRLLADLYADPERLRDAARSMNDRDRRLLRRDRSAPWTVADVALLDEAAELLGEAEAVGDPAAAGERAREVEYAHAVLGQHEGGYDDEVVTPGAVLTAEQLADRQRLPRVLRTAAEQAAGDRTWAFGHVIVDEAQELSPMQWRVLMRRCPSRSMTLVGDTAQTSSVAGARSWGDVLSPYVERRWRLRELTVNYRTPGRIMTLAENVLAQAGVTATPVTSARDGDAGPVFVSGPVETTVGPAVIGAREAAGAGTVAVIVPRGRAERVRALVDTDERTAVLTATETKGLEFDVVVIVEPSELVAESPRGINDLYVALTRPTQRLTVLHDGELPPGLSERTGDSSVADGTLW